MYRMYNTDGNSPFLCDILISSFLLTDAIYFLAFRGESLMKSSGMKEDLHLKGNELNYITIVFWTSYCVLMIPACYLLTRTRVNIALPALEAIWGLFTFGCAWAQNIETIYAMRFFIGAAETCTFTGTIYIIGCWYKPREIGRRVSLFFIASPLGTMFAGTSGSSI